MRIHLYAEHLDVHYAQRHLERIPRLRGKGQHRIQYRHIIDWLVRKPGAFAHYRYRNDLFPTTRFRLAYDTLDAQYTRLEATQQYLQILYLAAHESETRVDDILGTDETLSAARVETLLQVSQDSDSPCTAAAVVVAAVDLTLYDALLSCDRWVKEAVV